MEQNDYLLVGHFTKDLIEKNQFQLGGTVYWSGKVAQLLGFSVKIFSSFGKDLKKRVFEDKDLKKIEIFYLFSKNSTTFKNVYVTKEGKRKQFLFSKAKKILTSWLLRKIKKEPKILHLAPVFQEVKPSLAKKFKSSFLGATLQGWLRKREKDFSVSFSFWKGYQKYLPLFDAVICSREDLKNDFQLAKQFSAHSKIFVLTQGEKGCLLFWQGKTIELLPQKVLKSGNFTGAGDVFAAAFFAKLFETKNPILAAKFANRLAFLHIQKGLENFALRKQN